MIAHATCHAAYNHYVSGRRPSRLSPPRTRLTQLAPLSSARQFVHSFHFFPLHRPRLSSFPILVSGPALSDVYKFQSSCFICSLKLRAPHRRTSQMEAPFPCRPILAQTSASVRRPSVCPRNCPGLQKYLMVRAREGEGECGSAVQNWAYTQLANFE